MTTPDYRQEQLDALARLKTASTEAERSDAVMQLKHISISRTMAAAREALATGQLRSRPMIGAYTCEVRVKTAPTLLPRD